MPLLSAAAAVTFDALALREMVVVHVIQNARAEAAHQAFHVAVLDVERRDAAGREHHLVCCVWMGFSFAHAEGGGLQQHTRNTWIQKQKQWCFNRVDIVRLSQMASKLISTKQVALLSINTRILYKKRHHEVLIVPVIILTCSVTRIFVGGFSSDCWRLRDRKQS